MGVYWMAVNIDRREAVSPSDLDESLKRWWIDNSSKTRHRVQELLMSGRWAMTDEIRALSDGGYHEHLQGRVTDRPADYDEEWTNVSTDQSRGSVHDDP